MKLGNIASIKRPAVCALMLVWFPTLATAAPTIQTIIPDLSDSNTLVIQGSGFETPEQPIILDTINSWKLLGTDGSVKELQSDALWEEQGSAWADPLAIIQQQGPYNESNNAVYYGKKKSYNRTFTPLNNETNRSLYVSWWFKPSMHPNEEGGSNKFIRIWDDDGGNNTRISWTNMHLTYSAKDLGISEVSWGTWSGNVGQWNLMEIYVSDQENVIKAWVNGNLLHNVTDFKKSPISTGLNAKLLGFDPSVADPYQNLEFSIDNLYVSKSQARIVASEFETWEKARYKNKPLFPSYWSSSELRVDASSLFSDSQTNYYIYVVDKSGNANSTGVSLCPKCPSPIELKL